MTLRRRWALSIFAILLLFGLNLAVYFWGNTRRTGLILELKTALESKDLVVEIRNTVADRQRDAEVMEPLLTSGAVRLEAGRLADIRARLESLQKTIDTLRRLAPSDGAERLARDFEDLAESWLDVYQTQVMPESAPNLTEEPTAETVPDTGDTLTASRDFRFRQRYIEVEGLLAELQTKTAADVERAEEDFAAVSELTDRITLAIFAASSLLAIGIAVWFSRFLRGALARYVTSEVADSILQTKAGLELGGEKRRITVLMADLRGFSSMSERIAPEKVVAVVNNFLGVMTEVIVASGGTIDEFIGDAILVLFGAPVSRPDHAEAAVECAIRMQLAMREVNDKNRAEDLPAVEMGIGVHTGEVVVGNIGSEKRAKYGAVGTSVNLAARIEANTVGGQILISAETLASVDTELRVDGRLEIHPKGLEEPVALFDIGGMKTATADELFLPLPGEALVNLPDEIAVRFTVMEGSRTGNKAWDGELVSLSDRAATVRTTADLAPLANLRIELLQGSDTAAARPFFAKVLSVEPADDTFLARFTSVDSETATVLERLRS